jgi:hypothetical protein
MPFMSCQITPDTAASASGDVLLAASPTWEIRINTASSVSGFFH